MRIIMKYPKQTKPNTLCYSLSICCAFPIFASSDQLKIDRQKSPINTLTCIIRVCPLVTLWCLNLLKNSRLEDTDEYNFIHIVFYGF